MATKDSNTMMMRNGAWCLTNLCREELSKEDCDLLIPTLSKLILENDNPDILSDAMWALAYISDLGMSVIEQILEQGICGKIIELLSHFQSSISLPALRAIGNFVTGEDTVTDTVLDNGLMKSIEYLIKKDDPPF